LLRDDVPGHRSLLLEYRNAYRLAASAALIWVNGDGYALDRPLLGVTLRKGRSAQRAGPLSGGASTRG
jgi:hypothetical protein